MFAMELPSDVPEEKLEQLINALAEEARKLGLYLRGTALNVAERDEDDPLPHPHQLLMQFHVGEHAFSSAVQEPSARKTDIEFKALTGNLELQAQIEAIRDEYRLKDFNAFDSQVVDHETEEDGDDPSTAGDKSV